MPTAYAIAYVPAASKAAAEAALQAYATGHSGDNFTVPLSANGSEPPTHYGTCAPVTRADLLAALPSLKAALGGDYHTVGVREYDRQRDWIDWLAARGLRPLAPPMETP